MRASSARAKASTKPRATGTPVKFRVQAKPPAAAPARAIAVQPFETIDDQKEPFKGSEPIEAFPVRLKGLWRARYEIQRSVLMHGQLAATTADDSRSEIIVESDGAKAMQIAIGAIHVPDCPTITVQRVLTPRFAHTSKYVAEIEAMGYRATIRLEPLEALGAVGTYCPPDWNK